MNELVITNYKNSTIYAVYEDKKMCQVSSVPKKETQLGNIYVGRVDNIVKNINAAFVNISDNLSCYLDLSATEGALFVKKQSNRKISIGDELIVQVIKEEVKTKAPVVSTNFSLSGKYAVLVHCGNGIQISKKITGKAERQTLKAQISSFAGDGYGIVLRTNAQFAGEALVSELKELIAEYQKIVTEGVHRNRYTLLYKELPPYLLQLRDFKEYSLERIVTNISGIHAEITAYLKMHPIQTSSHEPVTVTYMEDANQLHILYKINHFMDQALHKTVYLNSGATIVIEPTEALTVIDVNTGKAISGKKATEETFLRINAEAAKEIASQIRLRNLSGIIIIDFINMEVEENKNQLKELLRSYLREDPVQTELVDITKLGLVEITRKKIYKTLTEQLENTQ